METRHQQIIEQVNSSQNRAVPQFELNTTVYYTARAATLSVVKGVMSLAMTERTGLDKEFDYYLEHQDELVKQYNGKIIVIKEGQVLGAYATHTEAIVETQKDHELGAFLVQAVSPGPSDYTQTFHSRVMTF